MFSETRDGRDCGVVEVALRGDDHKSTWEAPPGVDKTTLDLARTIYFQRHVVNKNNQRKALITIHGIRSHAEWNAEIAHIASSSGWIVAPFNYGYAEASQVVKSSERQKIVDRFRDHINDIFDRYNCHTSVIAHSFGTYVIAKYLLGFDVPPVSVDTLILTGSVLNETLDVDRFKGRASKIINEIAPNDGVVPYARMIGLWQDNLLGNSGEQGFKKS
jgi:pimeloyl-ACP methyl ester carboxylesterase